MAKVRVTKPIRYNKRNYRPGETVRMPASEADRFYYTGCVDDADRRDRKGRIKHDLDKRGT